MGEPYIIKVYTKLNLGDGIIKYGFIHKLCNTENIKFIDMKEEAGSINYLIIGSVMCNCDKNTIVCGTGFISERDDLGSLGWSFHNKIINQPKDILFVRGPKTRDKLIRMGLQCPESYGDMGLLMPLVYPMKSSKIKYKVGILPHYIDIRHIKPLEDFLKRNNISYTIINICKADRCQEFVDDISEVEYLISSTLHGLIAGISYNIKTIWVQFSNKVTGGTFKYEDFFSSIDCVYNSVAIDKDIFNNTINVSKDKIRDIGINMLNKIPFFQNEKSRENKIKTWIELTNEY